VSFREERKCRFCGHQYPDWRSILTPAEINPITPVMAVSVHGQVHKIKVHPGPDGKEEFKRQLRELLGYDDSEDFDVIFECKTPHSGEDLYAASNHSVLDDQTAISGTGRSRSTMSVAWRAFCNKTKHCDPTIIGPEYTGSSSLTMGQLGRSRYLQEDKRFRWTDRACSQLGDQTIILATP
jgi:hypothetical protein